jgi:HPt (histidine-containing phosphotransfer) domain-containing protein
MIAQLLEAPARHTGRGFAASYLRFCAAHLDELSREVENKRWKRVRRIANVLRGNTTLLGLGELAELGRELELGCERRDATALRQTCRELTATIRSLCDGQSVAVAVRFGDDGLPRCLHVN